MAEVEREGAINVFFQKHWAKKVILGVQNSVSWAKIALLHDIAYRTELNLQF